MCRGPPRVGYAKTAGDRDPGSRGQVSSIARTDFESLSASTLAARRSVPDITIVNRPPSRTHATSSARHPDKSSLATDRTTVSPNNRPCRVFNVFKLSTSTSMHDSGDPVRDDSDC